MIEYGTNIVGGVTPKKGGQTILDRPVFNTVQEAVEATGADVSVMYVPAPFAKGAMLDAANSDIKLLVAITEGVPTLDVLEAYETLSAKGHPAHRPELPRTHYAGRVQNRDHAGLYPYARQDRRHLAQRHADLRDRESIDRSGPGPEHLRGYRRGPGYRQ